MQRRRATALLCASLLAGCGGGGGDAPPTVVAVDPTSPNSVANAILLEVGGTAGTSSPGAPPLQDAATSANAPVASVDAPAQKIDDTSGSSTSASVSFEANSAIAAIFAKVTGASTFFTITPPPGGKATHAFTIDLQLLAPFETGQFCLELSGRDADGLVSNVQSVCVVTAPANSLQGTYSVSGSNAAGVLFTFFSDGYFFFQGQNNDPNCTPNNGAGLEFNTYSWSPNVLTFGTPIFDTNGDCGPNAAGSGPLTKNADGTLTGVGESGPLTFTPVASTPGTLIGSFEAGISGTTTNLPTPGVVTFLDDSHFLLSRTLATPGSQVGIQDGCYAVDPSTHVLTVDISPTSQTCTTFFGLAPIDTIGGGGFAAAAPGSGRSPTLTITGINTLAYDNKQDGVVIFTRIPAPPPP